MPILTNVRHEKFAQGLAKGLPADRAYVDAGYAFNSGNCIRLKGDERVSARVAELQQQGAAKAGWTIERVVEALWDQYAKAVADRQHGPATRCLELIGRTCGAFIDRSVLTVEGELADGALISRLARGNAELEAMLRAQLSGEGFGANADDSDTRH